MCRNIKVLYNFEPPVSDEEIEASALQFVRKVSGFQKPSKANEEIFNQTVKEISKATKQLISGLQTNASPRNREAEAQKARRRAAKRFGTT